MDNINRFHWNLARGFTGITTVFAILGIFSNSLIVLTTIHAKFVLDSSMHGNQCIFRNFRATYNVLIAVCACADILHHVSFRLL